MLEISIHPPRVGWDMIDYLDLLLNDGFQSTHPVWGGTAKVHKTGRRTFAQIIKYRDIPPVFQLFHRFSRRFPRILSQLFCANRAGRACPLPLRTP